MSKQRSKPNILVTGTPGTEKTTTCALLSEATNFRHINVGELAKEKNLYDGWDEKFECHVIDEDAPPHRRCRCWDCDDTPATTTPATAASATTTPAEASPKKMSKQRSKPNILVTGTPGTGKTTTCALLSEATNFRHINVGELAKEKNLYDGWDEKFECHVIDEDALCDEIEDLMEEGGNLVDYHGCDFFPERWFDCVVVLQTENSALYDRLTKRGYTGAKLTNNIECEIFQVLLEEARENYKEDIVLALRSDNVDDVSKNVNTLAEWIKKCLQNSSQ